MLRLTDIGGRCSSLKALFTTSLFPFMHMMGTKQCIISVILGFLFLLLSSNCHKSLFTNACLALKGTFEQ